MMTEATLADTEVADYRLERLIGEGGMGQVYLAHDLALGRRVALKLLASHLLDDRTARERFQREIETAARIEHVGIVPVYAAGFDPATRRFFIAMRFVDGPDLHEQLRDSGPYEAERAVRLLGQLGAALHAVHVAGMVHRDIKPRNVLLWAPGEPDEHALLTDFGIARAIDDSLGITSGAVIGTPAYIAPEVWQGEPASQASDQYALACVAYEMLTGEGPYHGGAGDARTRHLEQRPCALPVGVGAALDAAVSRALAKDPSHRFPSVRGFLDALGGRPAFDRSEAVTRVLHAPVTTEVLETLTTEFGFRDVTVAQFTDLEPSEIVRRRRLAARRAVVGDDSGVAPSPRDVN